MDQEAGKDKGTYTERIFNPDEAIPLVRGFEDLLGNALSEVVGNKELREIGATVKTTAEEDYQSLIHSLETALDNIRTISSRIASNQPLLIESGDDLPSVDLRRVNYKELNQTT